MRHRAAELGDRARYIRADTYREGLREAVGGVGGRGTVTVHHPTSHAALRLVRSLDAVTVLPARGFLVPHEDFGAWADGLGGRRLRQEDFYRWVRRGHDLLIDGDAPAGGRWNHDHDNREPPPRNAPTLDAPAPYRPREDAIDEEVRHDLDRWESSGEVRFVGRDGPRGFPASRREALAALRRFVEHRLTGFGAYEDAMLAADPVMSHSLLASSLNLGLLDPAECVEAAEDAWRSGRAPINSVEGFVRQIAGWREYVWQLYWHFGDDYRDSNALRHHTPLPELVPRSRRRRRDCPLSGDDPRPGPRHRLDPPHPAADAARQLRPPARLGSAGGHGLVPPLLRRRLRLGHAAQRRRDVPVRRRRADDHQALHLRRRVRAPHERPVHGVRLPSDGTCGGTCLSVHHRLLGLSAPASATAVRQQPDEPGGPRARARLGDLDALLRQARDGGDAVP